MSKEKLYIAYGSNLNLEQMKHRCPTAEVVGTSVLHGWQLRFRGGAYSAVATIERSKGSEVPVLIWRLQPRDELALDYYEGIPVFYRKETLRITVNEKRVRSLIYIMNEEGLPYGSPSARYLNTIQDGYKSTEFDTDILQKAVDNCKGTGQMDETVRKQLMRVFLIRLGFVGTEYQTARAILLRNLTGNSSWLTGPPPARHRRNRKRLPPPPAPPAAIEDYGKNGVGLLNSLADWLLANGIVVSDEERSNEHVGVRTVTVCWRNKNYLITQVDGITCKVEKV